MVVRIGEVCRSEEVAMAARATEKTPHPPRFADVAPKPLSIRSLDYRRGASNIVDRVRGEFVEMRGFSPTVQQAARLFSLSTEECGRVLSRLVEEGFLRCTADGRYRLPA
jgi:hypothetical protein